MFDNFSQRESEILNRSIETIRDELNPKKIILFGSRAKGTNFFYSDFDFAIDVLDINFEGKRSLVDKLEIFIGLYTVDLVFFNEVDNDFKEIILNSGIILYEKRDQLFVR